MGWRREHNDDHNNTNFVCVFVRGSVVGADGLGAGGGIRPLLVPHHHPSAAPAPCARTNCRRYRSVFICVTQGGFEIVVRAIMVGMLPNGVNVGLSMGHDRGVCCTCAGQVVHC